MQRQPQPRLRRSGRLHGAPSTALRGVIVVLASLPIAVVMGDGVAKLTKHRVYGSSSVERLAVTAARATFGAPGYETDRHYLAALLALLLGGSGACLIHDHRQRRRRLTG